MQIFMYGSIAIWQFGVLVILEQKSDQEHFICKSEDEADDLYDQIIFKIYDTQV